ncbi:MAG: ABC-ATPase domain-containing protein [Spirochaetales bacterium]|nr:ABC-ATPase domain-containing protein [Spirochaetales bacterium]
MQTIDTLRKKISAIDGKDYGAYQSLIGVYEYGDFILFCDRIPKDPYAPPHTGIYRLRIPRDYTTIPSGVYDSVITGTAYRDFCARKFYDASSRISGTRLGTGYSGIMTIDKPGQSILERSSVVVTAAYLEIRFFIGLPAEGRNITSQATAVMLCDKLPAIVETSLFARNIDTYGLEEHIRTAEDADCLRKKLTSLKLVAFIADGAILPRRSGTDDKPMEEKQAVFFRSPARLRTSIALPHAGTITGMGIPEGITLIVGGGYHGKSTLLNTISHGVYNHIPGDGRERCVSNQNTIKIRSYSGRYIEKVDISPFINNLPSRSDTRAFSTENASGSTSQAAAIQEAVEAGAEVLLMDEDTCATNFMLRDHKMQMLVDKKDEPITAFIDKARPLFTENGVSTVLALGGSGDYFDIADRVIQMKRYVPYDVTGKAFRISRQFPSCRSVEDRRFPRQSGRRIPLPGSMDPRNEYGKESVYMTEVYRIHFGKTIIDLTDVEQLVELSQTKAVAAAIVFLQRSIDGKKSIREILDAFEIERSDKGIDFISEKISGHFAGFRILELACAINRLRGMKMR